MTESSSNLTKLMNLKNSIYMFHSCDDIVNHTSNVSQQNCQKLVQKEYVFQCVVQGCTNDVARVEFSSSIYFKIKWFSTKIIDNKCKFRANQTTKNNYGSQFFRNFPRNHGIETNWENCLKPRIPPHKQIHLNVDDKCSMRWTSADNKIEKSTTVYTWIGSYDEKSD